MGLNNQLQVVLPPVAARDPQRSTIMARVQARHQEADGVISVELVCSDGGPMPSFTAGSHINLHLPGGMRRSYSLHNNPAVDGHYAVAVGRAPNSRGGSQWIHDHLAVGEILEIDPPRNNFALVEGVETILIAGGIGITPLLSMAHALAASRTPWQLHYAVQSRGQAAFVPTLQALAENSSGEFHLHVVDEAGGALLDMGAILAAAGERTHVYCCGPGGMLDAFDALAADLGPRAHTERFAGASVEVDTENDLEEPYEVHLKQSGLTFEVDRNASILAVLKNAGVDVNWSCQEGTCGTCEIKVLDGAVIHRDHVLSDLEKSENATMMICVSRAAGKCLTLDL
jgi:tetrachlorobenzoquinone reductase